MAQGQARQGLSYEYNLEDVAAPRGGAGRCLPTAVAVRAAGLRPAAHKPQGVYSPVISRKGLLTPAVNQALVGALGAVPGALTAGLPRAQGRARLRLFQPEKGVLRLSDAHG